MARTRNVSVRISTEGVSSSMEQIEEFGEQGARSLGKIERGIGLILKAGVGFIAFNVALNGVRNAIGFLEDAVDRASRLADASDALGVGAESLQRWELAAKEAGIESEQFENLLGKLNVKLGEAREGNQKAVESFAALGIGWQDLQGLNTEAAFLAVADAIAKIEDPAKRAALAADLLGERLGPKVQGFLAKGGEAINRAADDIARLGGVLDDEAIKKADEVGDAFDEMGTAIGNFAAGVAIDLLPSAETVRSFGRDVLGTANAVYDTIRDLVGLDPKNYQAARRRFDVANEELRTALKERQELTRDLAYTTLGEDVREQKSEGISGQIGRALRDQAAALQAMNEFERKAAEAKNRVARKMAEPLPSPEIERPRLGARKDSGPSDAEREAAAIKALRAELDPLTAAQERYNESLTFLANSDAPDRVELMTALFLTNEEAIDRSTGKTKEASAAERELNKRREEGARITESVRTPIEDLNAELARLTDLADDNTISWETFTKAVAAAEGRFKETQEAGESLAEELTRAFEGFGRRSAKALADVAVGLDEANVSAENLLQTLGSEVLEQLIFKSITGPLSEGLGEVIGGLFSSGGGWWGFADGAAFDNGRLARFALGGVVTRPTLFPMADGMGLMGEAGPEGVLPLMRGHDGRLGVEAHGGGGVVVNIIDQRGANAAPVERRERRGRDGRREIDFYIRDSVNRQIAQGGFDDAMGQSYGLCRVPQVMRG